MVLKRNNVTISGQGSRTIVFSHGFGCDQHMWTDVGAFVRARFPGCPVRSCRRRTVDLSAYDSRKYSRLDGYAEDVVEIGHELQLEDAVFVGHSVSAMIGALASIKAPGMFSELVMVGPSPRYIDDHDYVGGFSRDQVHELLDFLADNHLGWSAAMAPAIMGNGDRPELGERLENSFCATDPRIAREFAEVTFLSDNRADLAAIPAKTLILQCRETSSRPSASANMSTRISRTAGFKLLDATGHCPNLSAPAEVAEAIREFV